MKNIENFLWGNYSNADFHKIKDKEYKYKLTILLDETGQYYEYCVDKNLNFPYAITLYGYETK